MTLWINVALSIISALAGGFIGGWVVAFRLGRTLQAIESRLEVCEQRLERGDKPVGDVPVLRTRLETVIEELRDIKRELREDRKTFVSHGECDRRHGNGS
ncbi:MAG: hypothetical protein GX537_03075 [Actinobacteria bacterium]|nr:hypothetical protein [Actinomycetota bacterium]